MNRNLVGSIYGSSFIKIAHFVPIRYQTWLPQTILVSDWLISKKIFSSVTAWPNESKFGRKHPWKVLYKEWSFSSNPLTNMAATGNSCFWLISEKPSPLKPLGQMNRNLVGSILGKSFIKITNLVPIRWQTWPPKAILVSDWLISTKSSSLKPLCQINRNLVGSILGRSSIKMIAHLVPIRHWTWPPQAILVSDWSISKYLLLFNCLAKWPKLGGKHLWEVLY